MENEVAPYSDRMSSDLTTFWAGLSTGELFFNSAIKEPAGPREEGVNTFTNSRNVWDLCILIRTGTLPSLSLRLHLSIGRYLQ